MVVSIILWHLNHFDIWLTINSGRKVSYMPPGLRKSGLYVSVFFKRENNHHFRCCIIQSRDSTACTHSKCTIEIGNIHSRGNTDTSSSENNNGLTVRGEDEPREAGWIGDSGFHGTLGLMSFEFWCKKKDWSFATCNSIQMLDVACFCHVEQIKVPKN